MSEPCIDYTQLGRQSTSEQVESSHWRQQFRNLQAEAEVAGFEWEELHQAALDCGDRWRAAWLVALVALALGIGIAVAQRWG